MANMVLIFGEKLTGKGMNIFQCESEQKSISKESTFHNDITSKTHSI
jgi:hypothetical protein